MRKEIDAAEVREAAFHRLFPQSPASENVIDSFSCALFQKYVVVGNSLTPEIPISFEGTLFVTAAHACFYLEAKLHARDLAIPLAMPFGKILSISKGKSGSMIRIVVEGPPVTSTEGDDDEEEEVVSPQAVCCCC